jgi:hypothetical protein
MNYHTVAVVTFGASFAQVPICGGSFIFRRRQCDRQRSSHKCNRSSGRFGFAIFCTISGEHRKTLPGSSSGPPGEL